MFPSSCITQILIFSFSGVRKMGVEQNHDNVSVAVQHNNEILIKGGSLWRGCKWEGLYTNKGKDPSGLGTLPLGRMG
jgi:hypothetical protein